MSVPFPERPAIERFGFLWPTLVDLLKEMQVPFVMSVQLNQKDEGRPHAYHLVPGMNPRIMFGAIIAREGAEGLQKLFPGMSTLEKMAPGEEIERELAEMEATDVPMQHIALPIFVDTMREIEEGKSGGVG